MAISTISYLNLSALAYLELNGYTGKTMAALMDDNAIKTREDLNRYELAALKDPSNPLRSWLLLDTVTTPSGMSAIALQNPDTKEVVFAFRGTELNDLGDIATDEQLFSGLTHTIPTQFHHAEQFVHNVLATKPDITNYSFTGHSLGGALAQYLTYKTDHRAVTFNAPGIGSVIAAASGKKVDYTYYKDKAINYANESDVIGNYRNDTRIGTNTLIHSHLNSHTAQDIWSIVLMSAVAGMPISMSAKSAILKNGAESTARLLTNGLPFGNHDLRDLLNDDGSLRQFTHTATPGEKQAESVANGTSMVYNGAKVAFWGAGEGAVKFADTAGYITGGVAYHAADGVKRFAKTSAYIADGLFHYTKEGARKFGETSGYIAGGLIFHGEDGVKRFITTSKDFAVSMPRSVGEGIWKFGSTTGYITGGLIYHGADGVKRFIEVVGDMPNTIASLLSKGADWFSRSLSSKDLEDISNKYQAATKAPRVDPLIFDLNGDGVSTTNLDRSTAYFDLDANGYAERTAWVAQGDGLLVLDRNGDGSITNGQELFGDQTLLVNGKRAISGFEALAEFDDNKDGKIDALDVVYAKLKIWQDANVDGVSTAAEMSSLAEIGIEAITLHSTEQNTADVMGNVQRRLGSFIKSDGSHGQMAEYLLARDTLATHDLLSGDITIPEAIQQLPNLQGAGNVSSLQAAMAKDATGRLQGLVTAFLQAPTLAERNQLFEDIVFQWVGASDLAPDSRGGAIDARQLAVLEGFMGTRFMGTNGENPNNNAVPMLQKAYNDLHDKLYADLLSITHLKDVMDNMSYVITEDGVTLDMSQVHTELRTRLDADPAAGEALLGGFFTVMHGAGLGTDKGVVKLRNYFVAAYPSTRKMIYSADRNTILGTVNNDTISATDANDTLYGDEGDDNLYADKGNDTLIGGTGNDQLSGGDGNDTYIFNKGDGQDVLWDTGGVDTVQFNYSANAVVFERRGQDMYIRLHDSSDTIKITEQYRSDTKKIETFTAANGYSISHAQVDNLIQAMASFQQDTGMTWQQALQSQSDQAQQIIQQYWTPPTV